MSDTRTTQTLATITVRRDAEIFGIDGGWFRARWHFSFDQYYDANHVNIGLLRVFNHDTLVPGAIWPMHPHRDVEGITYVVDGEFEHADSLGSNGVLLPGGVQRMTLGSGALHSERNHSQVRSMEFIQMWVMPDTPGLPPSVEQKQYAVNDRHNRLLQILRPRGTEGDGVTVHQDARMFVSRLDPDVAVGATIPEGHVGYFYLIDGAAELNGQRLAKGDAAKITGSGLVRVRADATSELSLVDVPMQH